MPAQVQLGDQACNIPRLQGGMGGRGLWQAQGQLSERVQIQLIGLQNTLRWTRARSPRVVQRQIATRPAQAFRIDEGQALCGGQKAFFMNLNPQPAGQAFKTQG